MFTEVVETLAALADGRATRLAMDTWRALHVRLGRMLVSDTPLTPDADNRSEPTLDTTSLGLRVTVVGGALGAGTAKIGKVTDQPLTVSDMGQTAITSAASTQVVTGHSGPGIVSITNPEDPGGAKAYLFPGTATSSKYVLAPGCTWGPYSLTAVESIQARGSGSLSLSWDYLTVT